LLLQRASWSPAASRRTESARSKMKAVIKHSDRPQ
jgi:hypothetical protein